MHDFHDIENTTTDAARCRFAFVVERHSCMSSTTLKTLRPMRPNVALLSLWTAFIHGFYDIENTTTEAAPNVAVPRVGRHSCMSYMKLKTLRPMRPDVALLSLWKAFLHEFHEVENTTADAAQCRFAFVVEGIHA
jgi:hypothetical protein